jgi:hypothetical protein
MGVELVVGIKLEPAASTLVGRPLALVKSEDVMPACVRMCIFRWFSSRLTSD